MIYIWEFAFRVSEEVDVQARFEEVYSTRELGQELDLDVRQAYSKAVDKVKVEGLQKPLEIHLKGYRCTKCSDATVSAEVFPSP